MYSRSIAKKISLLTLFYDCALEDLIEFSELEPRYDGGLADQYVDEAKQKIKNYRKLVLLYHLSTINPR